MATGPRIVALTGPSTIRPASVHTEPVSPHAGSGEWSEKVMASLPLGFTTMSNRWLFPRVTLRAPVMVPPVTSNIVSRTVL